MDRKGDDLMEDLERISQELKAAREKERRSFDVSLPYTEADLAALLSSQAWLNLTPNQTLPDSLNPQDLEAAQIQRLIVLFAQKDFLLNFDSYKPFSGLEVSGLGRLHPLGGGQAKQGYLLTGDQGKKMAVLVGKGYNLGLQIPQDPYLTAMASSLDSDNETTTTFSFSDLRTYFCAPIKFGKEFYSVLLQEYAGDRPLKQLFPWTKGQAIQRVQKYIEPRRLRISEPKDFNKPEHYFQTQLFKQPLLIDITVDDRYKNHWEHYQRTRRSLGQ